MNRPTPSSPDEPRDARVEQLARAIREGRYDPDPALIAASLIEHLDGECSPDAIEGKRAVATAH